MLLATEAMPETRLHFCHFPAVFSFLFYFFSFYAIAIHTCVTVPIAVRITLLICLSSFSIYIFLSLIHAYVYLKMCTHFPPLPCSYTRIAKFICMFCVLFYIHNHLFVFFFLFLRIQ